MATYAIKSAFPNDHQELTEISFRSKAFWGYPQEWIALWKEDLTVTPEYISQHKVFKLQDESGKIMGFCGFTEESRELLEITHLWLLPSFTGKGLGTKLLTESIQKAIRPYHRKIEVVADPNAEKFYAKNGFTTLTYVESTPPGRMLPNMIKWLK